MKMVFNVLAVLAVGLGGWLAGSLFPAPPAIKRLVGQQAQDLGRLELGGVSWATLQSALPQDRLAALQAEASEAAAASGQAILVEHVEGVDIASIYGAWTPPAPPEPAMPAPAAGAFETSLNLCPKMTVSNAPNLEGYAAVVSVNGVAVAANPTRGACLSSGFGPRGSSTHKGVDYHSDTGGPILAAADGVILEMKYRDDYGNMLLIDHGQGVYTRYAHLSSFGQGLALGAKVQSGQEIGLMGNTAAYRIPIHLHYEVLTGDYANPKGSFGLKANSPFEFPKAG